MPAPPAAFPMQIRVVFVVFLRFEVFGRNTKGWRPEKKGTGSGCLPSRPDGPEPEGASGQQSVDHGLQPQQIAILIGAAGIVLGMPGRADQERIEFYSDRANPPGQSGGMVYVNEFAVALDKTARKVMPPWSWLRPPHPRLWHIWIFHGRAPSGNSGILSRHNTLRPQGRHIAIWYKNSVP